MADVDHDGRVSLLEFEALGTVADEVDELRAQLACRSSPTSGGVRPGPTVSPMDAFSAAEWEQLARAESGFAGEPEFHNSSGRGSESQSKEWGGVSKVVNIGAMTISTAPLGTFNATFRPVSSAADLEFSRDGQSESFLELLPKFPRFVVECSYSVTYEKDTQFEQSENTRKCTVTIVLDAAGEVLDQVMNTGGGGGRDEEEEELDEVDLEEYFRTVPAPKGHEGGFGDDY